MKTAVDSELDDYHENVRYEDHFLITGLPGPESGLSTRDWQGQVQRQVKEKLQILLGRPPQIAYISNATGARKDGIKSFLVKMVSREDSKLIRDKFGSYFKAGAPPRPSTLIGLSIRNRLTLGTRVRIEIMKLLAERYKASNPGSKTQVVNYESRPTMKFTPSTSASDRRPLHFTYIKAVTKLPCNFTDEELAPIYRMVTSSTELTGKLRSTFIVLSDDKARELSRSSAPVQSAAAPAGANGSVSRPARSATPATGSTSAVSSRDRDRDRTSRSSQSNQMEHDRSRSRSPIRSNNA